MSTVPSLKPQHRPSSSCSKADCRQGGLVRQCPSSARLETSQQVRNESQWRRSIVTYLETDILTVLIQTDTVSSRQYRTPTRRQNQLITRRISYHKSTCTRDSTFSPQRAHAASLLESAPTACPTEALVSAVTVRRTISQGTEHRRREARCEIKSSYSYKNSANIPCRQLMAL